VATGPARGNQEDTVNDPARPEGPGTPTGLLFHLALVEDWARARQDGSYRISTRGATLGQVGFVHASFAHQLAEVAEASYADLDADLVVLVIDEPVLGVPVVVEPGEGTQECYPHIYGPVPVSAVLEARPVGRDPAGRLILPPLPGARP
jgi:uncharacterized protein (DUF952 family)